MWHKAVSRKQYVLSYFHTVCALVLSYNFSILLSRSLENSPSFNQCTNQPYFYILISVQYNNIKYITLKI
jgi:hypothetical protein